MKRKRVDRQLLIAGLTAFCYGMALLSFETFVTIVTGTVETFTIFYCLIIGAISIVASFLRIKHRNDLMIVNGILWVFIAWMYSVNPIPNNGNLLAISIFLFMMESIGKGVEEVEE